jgi:segregation and condensation protein B
MEQNHTPELILQDPDQIQAIVYPMACDLEYPREELTLELDYLDDTLQEDKLWKARTGLNEDTLCGAIETLVFMSDRPIALAKIRAAIDEDLPLRVIHEAISRLQKGYEEGHHGIRLVEVAEGYQFRTKATYSRFVQDLFKVNSLVLTPTALEVLAIIAYKQPVGRPDIDKIRGVDSSHIVRALMDKRLVKVVGRSEEMGRPVLYGTTPEFMEVFNLASLNDLPPEHELDELATQSIGKISDISGLVQGDKKRFMFDEIAELDELSETIKSIAADTDFTLSLKVEAKKRTDEQGEKVKTAFDLLEEFVERTQLVKQMNEAHTSTLPTPFVEARVISDLEGGPYNIPLDEEEEFEMIDLDTGEPLRFDDEEMTEEEALSQALDDAFDRLTAQRFDEGDEQFHQEMDDLTDEVARLEDNLEGLSDGIFKDFDEKFDQT